MLLPVCLHGQIKFQKTIGNDACTEEAQSLAIRNDTSLFLASQQICGAGPRTPLLYSFDQYGDTITTFTNPPYNGNILKQSTSIYSFLGDETFSVNNDSIHLFQVKADSGIRWQQTYFKGTCNNSATAQASGLNGSTLFTGIYSFTSCSNPIYNSFYSLADRNGNTQWTRFIKGGQNDQIHAAQQTPDNNFVLAGWTDSRSSGKADFLLVKTNTAGDTLWSKTYGDQRANKCYSLAIAPDSGFYLLGYDDSIRLIKIDNHGVKEWTKVLGKACGGSDFSIDKSRDKGYSALTLQEINGTCRSVLYKIKPDGSIFWRKVFQKGRLNTYQELPDTSYFLAGYVYDTATFQSDIFVTGFDSSTYTESTGTFSAQSTYSSKTNLTIEPNPVSKRAIVRLKAPKETISKLSIYTYNGKKVRQIRGHGKSKIVLQKKNLSGLYLINIRTADGKMFWARVVFLQNN